MTGDIHAHRNFLIYGICGLLAIFVGYLLATPLEIQSYSLVGLLLVGLCIPMVLKWHHAALFYVWNATLIVFFLPGQPSIGVMMIAMSFGMAIFHRAMRKSEEFIRVPSISMPLILLAVVVMLTAKLTGGIGSKAFGSEAWGARRYLGLFGGIAGYFALTAQRIPAGKGMSYAGGFFLSGLTAAGSDLAYAIGPAAYFLFALFSSELAGLQAMTEGTLYRLTGVAWAAQALAFYMLLKYGIRNLMDLTKPWRLLVFIGIIIISMFGGYRSTIIMLSLIFLFQFWLEGLFRTKLFPLLLLAGVLLGTTTVLLVDKLPLSIQRSLSFLPLNIAPEAKHDALGTLDWRLQMWKIVIKDVPHYLWLGKGYSFSSTDFELTREATQRGLFQAYEDTLVSGNYHNGILTLIIPFGIFGFLGFAWFCWSAVRVLYQNYKWSDGVHRRINCFLLAYFLGRLVFYLVFYGQFDSDLIMFTGVVGLSLSLNNGVLSQPGDGDTSGPRMVKFRPVGARNES